MSWAWDQRVGDPAAKLVLMKLADQANDQGKCWPSQRSLADECEMSLNTVRRKLELLYAAGLVSAEQRRRDDGGLTSLMYRVGFVPLRPSGVTPYATSDAPPTPTVAQHEPSLEPRPTSDAVTPTEDERTASIRDSIERSLRVVA